MFVSKKRFDALERRIIESSLFANKELMCDGLIGFFSNSEFDKTSHNDRIKKLEKKIDMLMKYLGVEQITTQAETKIVKKSKKKKQLYPILAKNA